MKTILWFVRHPIYAGAWFATGRPYSDVFAR